MPPRLPTISEAARSRLFNLGIFLLILGFGIARGFYLPESDLFWEIRAGQMLLTHGTIPHTDTWAWLIQGRPWLPNSWAWNVLLALAFNLGGTYGLGVVNLLLYVGIFLLSWRLLRLLGVSKPLLMPVLIITLFNSLFWLTLRPQEADYVLLLTFILLVARWRESMTRPKALWLILAAYVITTLWMNMHLTGTSAIVLLPAAYLLLTHGNVCPRMLTALGIGAAALLGSLSTPFGLDGITKGGAVLQASRGIIFEWTQITFALPAGILAFISIVIYGGLPVLFLLLRRRWIAAAFLLAFAIGSFEIPRFVPYLIFFALITVTALPERLNRSKMVAVYNYIALGAIAVVLGLALALPKLLYPNTMFSLDPTDLNSIPKAQTQTRVLTLSTGGGLMELYRHDLSPSLDSRNDIYGMPLYLKVVGLFYYDKAATVEKFIQENHVQAVYVEVFPTQNQPPLTIVPIMRHLGWHEIRKADAYIFLPPGVA